MLEVTECRCCQSSDLIEYLDLGDQPLANSYHKGEELARYPLKVLLCRSCFLSQLSVVIDPDEMFRNYLYVSGTTYTLKSHWKEFAADAVSRVGIGKVLDIAANDCANLEPFRDLGCEVMGVDPALNLRELSTARGIDVIVDYWREGLVPDDEFSIITAANVFAHVHDVNSFLAAAKKAVRQDGLIILEFPYCREMLKKNYVDQIYHEHLSYFLTNAVYRLVDSLDLKVADVLLTPIHGGSIRFFISKDPTKDHADVVFDLIRKEHDEGLLSVDTYFEMAKEVDKNREDLVRLLSQLKNEGKKVISYGASAKSSTIFNGFSLDVEYIIDDNPLKWGYQTPGRNILIRDPKDIAHESEKLYILLTAWNFASEIKKKVREIRGHNLDEFIYYVPNVYIEKENTPLN